MFIWLLALVLVGGFAAIGFQTGAIRSLVSLVGVLIGLAVAGAVGGILEPLVAKMATSNPMWLYGLPTALGFLLVWLVFFGAGFAAHKPVELHFKYREDDATREQFEQMNKALGVFVGMLAGVIVFFAVGKPLYSMGYLTTQLNNDTTEVAPVKLVTQARTDMASSGWDRTFAALDSTPQRRYEIDNLLGFIHDNPAVRARILTYPPLVPLVERSEITDILGDAEYLKLLDDKAGLTALHNHAKTQAVLASSDMKDALSKLDLKDLKTYLETGKSPLFGDEKILGHWSLDSRSTSMVLRRINTTATLQDISNVRRWLNKAGQEILLTAYLDGRFVIQWPTAADVRAGGQEAPAAEQPAEAAAAPAATPTGLDPVLARRYGLRTQTAAPAPKPAETADRPVTFADVFTSLGKLKHSELLEGPGEGTWTKFGGGYQLEFNVKDGKKGPVKGLEAHVNDQGKLEVSIAGSPSKVFFTKLD